MQRSVTIYLRTSIRLAPKGLCLLQHISKLLLQQNAYFLKCQRYFIVGNLWESCKMGKLINITDKRCCHSCSTTIWRFLWSITIQTHGNKLFCFFFNNKKWKSLLMVTLSVRLFSNIVEVRTNKVYKDCICDPSLSWGSHLSESHA